MCHLPKTNLRWEVKTKHDVLPNNQYEHWFRNTVQLRTATKCHKIQLRCTCAVLPLSLTAYRHLILSVGPMTSLLISQLYAALTPRTWSPHLGRERPYSLIDAIMCSTDVLIYLFSIRSGWPMDYARLLTPEIIPPWKPYRTFIAEKLAPSP